MKPFLIIVALLLVCIVVAAFQRMRTASSHVDRWPFYAKRPLSPPEQVLFHRLVKALPDHMVLAQVQLSRVLGVKKGFNFHQWNNRINRMSYDFVVCAMDSTVLAAIELDDRSHESPARLTADAKKDRASAAAGIRLVRWNVKALPDDTEIRAAVAGPPAEGRREPTF